MAEVIFQIENGDQITVSANTGDNLLEIARGANIAIDAPCSGNGSCGKCRVRLLEGKLDGVQTSHISDEDYADGWRLSCSSRIADTDVTILVPDIASAYQSRIKTADLTDESEIRVFTAIQENMQQVELGIANDFESLVVTMPEPTLDDTLPDNERLIKAVRQATGLKDVRLGFYALEHLPEVLRENNFTVSVICEKQNGIVSIYDVEPVSEAAAVCGIAIDIGTTTVSGVLADMKTGRLLAKASAGNGQIRYGADVINRIIEQSKKNGREKLRKAIVEETLVPMTRLLLKSAKVNPGQIVRVTIAGNSTMNHLLVGVCANPLRMEPYIPAFFSYPPFEAVNLLPSVNPQAKIVLAPNIGSYVGGDITAGTMASMIWHKETFSLFIDLGTNGEIVFGNSDFLMSCACSAGPAFEGGDISCGMRATDGAVESVKIDLESMEPTLGIVGKEGQKAVGICGSGIIDSIAELFRTGIIDSKGKFTRSGSRILRDEHGMGSYLLVSHKESETGRDITITEVDIESFIRAKGAIYSAIDTMLKSLDMTPDFIENIYVAGGIGSGINIENAIRIGMVPDVDREKYHYIGNSSLAGAYAMLLSDPACSKVHEIASNMTYLELSTYPGYMDFFVAACFIPHTDQSLFPSSCQERK